MVFNGRRIILIVILILVFIINIWFVIIFLCDEGFGDNRFGFYMKGMIFYFFYSQNVCELLFSGMIKGDNGYWNGYDQVKIYEVYW